MGDREFIEVYMYVCQNKAIAKIKWCSFLPHTYIYFDVIFVSGVLTLLVMPYFCLMSAVGPSCRSTLSVAKTSTDIVGQHWRAVWRRPYCFMC